MTTCKLAFKSRTKAEVLSFLTEKIQSALILPLFFFEKYDWIQNQELVLKKILTNDSFKYPLIVRSSGKDEDTNFCSNAGAYETVLNVKSEEELKNAIQKVIESFKNKNLFHQVLIQPQLTDVKCSGVIFTKDPNGGGDYIVINYDQCSHKTDTITSGATNDLMCYVHHKKSKNYPPGFLGQCIRLAIDLEAILESDSLDIEFATDKTDKLYLFQARPLIVKNENNVESKVLYEALCRISSKIKDLSKKHPYLSGDNNIFGVMPDWNPAEIIGVKPKPLSFSLYRNLVTDSVWAYQRNNYGYRNLRSFPLIVDFEGLPYVDTRVSFNSFIPKKIPEEIADKLVNYYLYKLKKNPSFHDKIEFEIVLSCYTFSLKDKVNSLPNDLFSFEEKKNIFSCLNELTQNIVLDTTAPWIKDLKKVEILKYRQNLIYEDKSLPDLSKIYWLIEDCKRYGVLPFAGLARAGFIAVEILKSLLNTGIFSQSDYDNFFSNVKTISSDIELDFNNLSKEKFLKKYGHLRPGTYDILSPSYSEDPDFYFEWSKKNQKMKETNTAFNLSLSQLRSVEKKLTNDGWNINILDFFDFLKTAIESREYSKFIFTKSIHLVLNILKKLSQSLEIPFEKFAYADITDILSLYSNCRDPKETLQNSIDFGRKQFEITKMINLPSIVTSPQTPFSFCQTVINPNFITQKSIKATTAKIHQDEHLEGKIVFIPNADPGFDWLFLKKIGGLVTIYGGINSHMAIRANELGIPSIIGAGDINYQKWSAAKMLDIDCLNKKVTVLA